MIKGVKSQNCAMHMWNSQLNHSF